MLLISNNLRNYMNMPKEATVRVNVAWVDSLAKLEEILLQNKGYDIFLDYPQGRTKFPKPNLLIQDIIEISKQYKNIKYFAISNVETSQQIISIKNLLPNDIQFVPKIETLEGVISLADIIKETGIKTIMLDKEDLLRDVEYNNVVYLKCIKQVRETSKKNNISLLELEAVIFTEKKL